MVMGEIPLLFNKRLGSLPLQPRMTVVYHPKDEQVTKCLSLAG